jgi:hypothetical protein
MPRSHIDDEFQDEYDDYIRDTPLEARFDPLTIEMLVVEAIPKHAAYEMTFEEYLKERARFSEYDSTEKKRLTFYLPLYPAMRSQDIADLHNNTSINRFLVVLLELGLITVLYDYHTEISLLKQSRREMQQYLTCERAAQRYVHMDRQKVVLHSTHGYKSGDSKHFSPWCQDWFYNAITDTASYINTSASDMAFLCWCMGMQKVSIEHTDVITDKLVAEVVSKFDFEFGAYAERVGTILSGIKADSELMAMSER